MAAPKPLLQMAGLKPGVHDAITGAVPPGEVVRGPILDWFVPPFAPFFPEVPQGVKRQRALQVVVTDSAVHFTALADGQVGSHTRISASKISAVTVARGKRMNKAVKRFLGEVEEVVLLTLWWEDKIERLETRYAEGLAQGQAIERLVSAWQGGGGYGGQASTADELTKLAELRGAGVLSDADWERAKDLYLGKSPDAKQEAIVLLNQLYNLHKAGALSQGEFNMKKWDVLSRAK